MRSAGDDVRYAYATGRVRALERTLLDDALLGRLAEASDVEGAAEFLRESPRYADITGALADVRKLDEALAGAIAGMRREVTGMTLDPELTDAWLARFELVGMKKVLRERYLTPNRKGEGEVSAPEGIPAVMADVFADAADVALATDDPMLADARVEAGYHDGLCAAARTSGSDFLTEFAVFAADVYNVRAVLRGRRRGVVSPKREQLFCEAGTIGRSDLLRAFRDEEDLPDDLARGRFSDVLGGRHDAGAETFLEHVDRLCDNALTGFMKTAKYFAFGVEPLVGYAYAVELEAANVRRILSGKILGLGADLVKERLRLSYV